MKVCAQQFHTSSRPIHVLTLSARLGHSTVLQERQRQSLRSSSLSPIATLAAPEDCRRHHPPQESDQSAVRLRANQQEWGRTSLPQGRLLPCHIARRRHRVVRGLQPAATHRQRTGPCRLLRSHRQAAAPERAVSLRYLRSRFWLQ